ncbi:hypothetical protein [Pseudomonas viridiflava]|uniref:hypothetical protein n=1 Tax=Pseudomonas viridiflava TaxID=33069 RepID=UPI0013C35A82|nr:hypothetical protein [Pseudomonas viridiflava]
MTLTAIFNSLSMDGDAGLFDFLSRLLNVLEPSHTERNSRPERPNRAATPIRPAREKSTSIGRENCGRVVVGSVVKILPKSVLVKYQDTSVLIPQHELLSTNAKVENPISLFSVGDNVEFVLTSLDEKGWKGSVHALAEARLRNALGSLQPGAIVSAQVENFDDRGAWLMAGQLRLWVPLAEISWSWIDHPSEALNFAQEHNVQISNLLLEGNWLTDKRARKGRVTASIKACLVRPESPRITLYFKAMEFLVRTFARVPRRCDAVGLFVLEALNQQLNVNEIAELTGLPLISVQDIVELLVEEDLVEGQIITRSGERLLAGVAISKLLNDSDVGGLFASAAPADQQIHPSHAVAQTYPRHLPAPVFSHKQQKRFMRLRGDELPDGLLARAQISEAQCEQLTAMLRNPHVRVFLSQTPNWKALELDVPLHWVLAGLWKNFQPVGRPPFRPAPKEKGCDALLMVRYLEAGQQLFWEPATRTVWIPRDGRIKAQEADVCEEDFTQHMSPDIAQRLAKSGPGTWCWVQL